MDITIYVQDESGVRHPLTLPTDRVLSLMEGLKAGELPVLGTCGGMALCASCHIEVLEGQVPNEPQDAEWSMLDTVPSITESSWPAKFLLPKNSTTGSANHWRVGKLQMNIGKLSKREHSVISSMTAGWIRALST